MTNKEKVKEISFNKLHSKLGDALFKISFPFGTKYIEDIEKSALEMAEWKDQQFKEYLEKKIKECDNISIRKSFYGDDYKKYNCFISAYKQIINELFGEIENVDYSNNDE